MQSILTTEIFDEWFSSLKDKAGAMRIQARIDRAEDGNFGDCAPVGEGGIGNANSFRTRLPRVLRPAWARRVILLAGGDKSTQSKDIKNALELAREL
jgi:putative addiction module killer protein